VAVENALQLEGHPTSVFLGCFRPNLYCACTETAISELLLASKFSDPDFLKESDNLAIRRLSLRRFYAVTLTFNYLTLNACIPCFNKTPTFVFFFIS